MTSIAEIEDAVAKLSRQDLSAIVQPSVKEHKVKSLLARLEYDQIDFAVSSSQQFATVIFDRQEDDEKTLITIFKDGKIKQRDGDNRYNPSARRHSSCIYVTEEWQDGKTIKICTIQHKGTTLVEIHSVSGEELAYLFGE